MTKQLILPAGVTDTELFKRGIIRVARTIDNPTAPYVKVSDHPDYLALIDHTFTLGPGKYKRLLRKQQERRDVLLPLMNKYGLAAVAVLEGRDAGGKTGSAKHMVEDVQFELFDVVHVGPPNPLERVQAYWLRFFDRDRMPSFGQFRVLDRSWYGELLVVPVDKLASKEHVRLAYSQLPTMEWLLRSSGIIVVKFWLDITFDEQGRRFDDRIEEENGKYQDSDKKAREQWDDYTPYINKMFYYTGSTFAPWNILPANDKRFTRVTCLTIFNDEVEKAIREAAAARGKKIDL